MTERNQSAGKVFKRGIVVNMEFMKLKGKRVEIKSVQENPAVIRTEKVVKKVAVGLLKAVFLIGFCFVILYPILTMISKAFMEQSLIVGLISAER